MEADMDRMEFNPERAPQVMGPYSVAIRAGNLVCTSGQIGIDPVIGVQVPGDVGTTTRQAPKNLQVVLPYSGTDRTFNDRRGGTTQGRSGGY